MKKTFVVTALLLGVSTLSVAFASNTEPTKIHTKVEHRKLQVVSLEQAQSEVPFQIVIPKDLPHGMVLNSVTVTYPPTGIDNPKLIQANLTFVSPDNKTALLVTEGLASNTFMGGKTKQYNINEKNAEYASTSKIAALHWSKGEVNFLATADITSDISSESTLIEIAKKFN